MSPKKSENYICEVQIVITYFKKATGNVTKILKNKFTSFPQIYSKVAAGNVTKNSKKLFLLFVPGMRIMPLEM